MDKLGLTSLRNKPVSDRQTCSWPDILPARSEPDIKKSPSTVYGIPIEIHPQYQPDEQEATLYQYVETESVHGNRPRITTQRNGKSNR